VNVLDLMGSGDMLLLCTDGVTEHASGMEPYVGERLEAWLRAHKQQPIRQLVDSLAADIRAFGPLKDDASVVIVRRS
jgi:serine phosphatase RsbU (regulator of sigma subunit)